MSAEYARDNNKIAVVKILQTLGWHSINSTPLEVLTDILTRYLGQLGKITSEYANEFGQTDPNLDHLGLTFQEMSIHLTDLQEYTTYVNFLPPAAAVPKFPLVKDSNLNFLKPGSKEVVTRPIHINEHLPPMYPLLEAEPQTETTIKTEVEEFKKPSSPEFRRLKKEEEGGRPTREISSVMMTTSGFLSPAREGRLPEAKAPPPPPEPPKPPSPLPVPELVPVVKKKREKVGKELFKPEDKPKKVNTMKEILSLKRAKAVAAHALMPMSVFNPMADMKLPPLVATKPKPSFNKALAAAKAKTEKLNTTITPVPVKQEFRPVDKLITEPDKKKINILRKISSVKDKEKAKLIQQTQDIVSKINLSSDITIEPIMHHSPVKVETYFDDGSPPGTPPTPRTPEFIAGQSPPFVMKEKRKRKEKPDKPRVKKPRKQTLPQPHFMDPDVLDFPMGRPKTPDALFMKKSHQFAPMPFNFPLASFGPGLIPNLANPLFPFASPIPDFGKNPYFQPVKPEPPKISPKPKEEKIVKQEPVEIVPVPVAPAVILDTPIKVEDDLVNKKKKDKKDKGKKKNKKEKIKDKGEKKVKKESKKDKVKKEKKKKPVDEEAPVEAVAAIPKILLKVNSPSPRPDTPDSMKKLNIKPVVKQEEPPPTNTELTKISALFVGPPKPKNPQPIPDKPAIPEASSGPSGLPAKPPGRPKLHPSKPKPAKPKKVEQPFVKVDADGNEVWICPACGQQDDGRPMIGCDGCDAWYHWVCVGIQVPPDENENWYCKPCLAKKNEDLQDKKKKRKKKDKVH